MPEETRDQDASPEPVDDQNSVEETSALESNASSTDADQLESMLSGLEDDSGDTSDEEAEEDPSEDIGGLADEMEALMDRMGSDDEASSLDDEASSDEEEADEPIDDDEASEEDLNDLLYQATLADVEQAAEDEDHRRTEAETFFEGCCVHGNSIRKTRVEV